MDRFDRVFCWIMSAIAIGGGMLLLTRFHSRKDVALIVLASIVLARWPWITVPQETRKNKIIASICGDNSGPEHAFCVLEPGHPGDHVSFHSSGGKIGWRRRT